VLHKLAVDLVQVEEWWISRKVLGEDVILFAEWAVVFDAEVEVEGLLVSAPGTTGGGVPCYWDQRSADQ
jgi:hypothetical protein